MQINFLSKSYQSIALFLRARRENDSNQDIPELHELEERVFYDASPLGVILSDFADTTEGLDVDDAGFVDQVEETVNEDFSYAPEWEQLETPIREIVFIDNDVEDYSLLIHDLAGQSDVAVYVLDQDTDGVQQITETLQKYTQLSAVHIVSHGSEGSFDVGGSTVSLANLDRYANEIAQWGQSLSADADFLIYGCNVAGSEDGRELIDVMESMIGADVAASEDLTGSSQFGGNWNFEYSTGSVETTSVFSSFVLQSWNSTLDVTGYPTSNGSDNSFEHISNVTFAGINNTSGADAGGYADYSAQNATVTIGQTNTLSVTISPDNSDYIVAWIDWNQDKDFNDAGEEYVIAENIATAGPHTIDILAPINAVAGDTIMRVSLKYFTLPSSEGTFFYGEVEDYTVTVVDPFQNINVDENSANGTEVIPGYSFAPEVTVASVLAGDASLSYDATTNKFYKVVSTGTTWTNAQAVAGNDQLNGISGQLVNIRSAYENSYVQSIVAPFGSELYIGGTDATVEGEWNWYDDGVEADRFWNGAVGGSAPSGAYANFHPGEPQGGTAENHIVIRASDGVWIDVDGTGVRNFVVEWDASEVINRYSFTLTDDAGGRFAIDSLTGEVTVADGSQLDYETNTSHNITVLVNDVAAESDLVEGLEAHYEFDGDATDSSNGPSYDGTLQGNAVVQNDAERGQVISLDGVGDYVDLSSHTGSFGSLAQGSISSWVNTSASTDQTIFTLSDSADSDSDVTLFVRSDGLVQFQVVEGGGAGTLVLYSSISVNDGQWHNIAITMDVGGPHLYIDGVEDKSLTFTAGTAATSAFFSTVNTPDAMAVGTRLNNSGSLWGFQGQLDDTRIYSRALTANEVSEIVVGTGFSQAYSVEVNSVAAVAQTVPGAQFVDEDSVLTFSSGGGNAISVSDTVTSTNTLLQVNLSVANGVLTLSQTTGLTFVSGSNGASSFIIQGTESDLNAALEGMTFTPTGDYSGSVTVNMTTEAAVDLEGHYEFEGNANDSSLGAAENGVLVGDASFTSDADRGNVLSLDGTGDTVQISGEFGQPANITTAAWVNTSGGYAEVISIAGIFDIRIDDPNVGGFVTGFYYDGTGYKHATSSVAIAGDGWHHVALSFDDATKQLTLYIDGNVAATQTFTNSIAYTGGNTFIGSNNGAGLFLTGLVDDARIYTRALSADEVAALANDRATTTDSISVTVNPINDTPVVDGPPSAYSVNEQAALSIHGTGFTVSDVDAGSGTMTATIAVGEGGVSVNVGDSGVSISSGNGSGSVVLTGTLTQIDNLLTGSSTGTIVYSNGNDAPSSSTTITVTVNDVGNTGTDPGLTGDATSEEDSAVQVINITGINDAPSINNLDGDLVAVVNDGSTIGLDAGVAATLLDPDNPVDLSGGFLQVAGSSFDGLDQLLISTAGSVTLSTGMANGSVVSVSGTSIGTLASVSSSGFTVNLNSNATLARVEAVIQAVEFSSTSTVFGNRSVDFTINDGDGVALGGADSDTASVTVNVFSSSGAIVTPEDTNYVFAASDFEFSGVVVADIQDITVTSLPANGLLKLNGTNVIVGQTISKADIDAGLFVFEPAADENGLPYANFDFYVNDGNQTLTILAGLTNSYTVGGSSFVPTNDILTNDANFGPTGTHTVDLQIGPDTSVIDSSYLSQGQIFFDGYVPDASWTAGYLSALDAWVASGGILISTNDDTGYDPVSTYFGLTIGGAGSATWNVANSTHEIMNGDFGLVGNVGDPFSASGTISYFSSASLVVGDIVLATDSGSGEPTMVLRQYGSGWILFMSDEGPFRAGMTGGGTVSTANDILSANVFAWASSVAAQQEFQLDINVSAVNDDPTNAGSLPTDVAVTEDVSTNIDLSAIDFSDVDAASGTLTVTLSTSTGGQLTASAGTGITIGGTADARTFTGTLTDLNNYFDNTTNISYLHGTANTNGDNADSITVVINDNGNTGSGGGTDQNLGTVNVDITAVNDDPTNAGSLPTDVTVTEDVLTNIDLSAVDFSDVDAASGTLTVTLSTSTGGQLTASAGTGITIGGTAAARTFTGTLTDLNNYFNNSTNISYLHGTANINGDNADSITVVINDNGNTGSGGGTDQNLGTVNVDITAVNDDPTNAGSLPTDVAVTEDVLTNIDLSAVDFSDVDAASGTLTVTLSTSTGGQLTASAGTGITIGGTATARTFTGTLTDLNNYFNNTTNISYLHGTANTNGDNADSITVVINDNGNTGSGGGSDQNLGTVNVDITGVNNSPVFERAAEIDFESYVSGNLDGQNGWTVVSYNTSAELQVSAGAGVDGGTAITFGVGGSGVGSSGFLVGESAIPDLANASSMSVEWSMRNNYWGNQFGIGTDENGDGQILGSSNEVALSVVVSSYTGEITVTLPDATTIAFTQGFSGGDWIDFRWEIDLTGNGGQGEGTLYFRNATLGESNWQTDPVLSNINLGLNPIATDKTNAEYWDGFRFHSEGPNGGLDNIKVVVDSHSGSADYVEGGSSIILDGNLEILDEELSALDNFDGASVTLVRNGGSSSDDVFSATGTLSALNQGSSLIVDGTSIGTVTTNSGGVLTLSFDTNATNELVNSTLQQIGYQNASDAPPSNVQIDWQFDDGNSGSQGSGGSLSATGSTTVFITAVNDDPTNAGSLPTDVAVTEDVLTNIDLSAIDFSDVDAASGTLTVTLSTSTGGQLTASAGTGITIGGTATARTFTGTLTDLNNYFNNTTNISYLHGTANTNGDNADSITVVINDNGNTGSGGGTDQNLGTVNVDITAVNDDPTNAGSLPTDVTVTEDVSTSVDLSAVDFSDVDAASGTLTVTLSTSTGGQLTASAGTGITIGGTATARTFTGTLTDLNNYFDNTTNISYLHGTANTNGDNADSITVVVNDNGNTGSGGGTDQNLGTVNVDITAVNDDPTNAGSLPTDVAVNEDVLTNIDLSAIDFSDVDAASGTLTVTLSTSTGGQLTASAGTGIMIGGTATARTFTGTLTDLNNYFNNTTNISYLHGTANTNGDNADSITVVINDNGNTGSGGGTDQNLGTVNVDITAVNDDPTNAGSLPTDVVVTEDVSTSVDLSAVDFSDVDAASGTLTVTLSTSTGGQLTASAGTGITIGGTATARTFTGTLTDLNNYFNNTTNISYLHGTANTNGDNADSITVVINDNGNTGSGGGTDQNLGTINVDITAVNDDPTNAGSLPTDVTVTEDVLTNIDLSAVDFSDVDAASGTLTVTLSTSTGGQLTASAGTGITIGGTATARTFTGTLTDLNNYFNNTTNISYLHGIANTNGDNADSITVVINDNGNTGSGGGTDQNLGTVNVDITAVNDDPTNAGSLPTDVAVTEDVLTNIDLSAIDFSDVDAASGTLTVTLSTSTGGQLTASAGTGITIGGTATVRTFTGTLTDLNNYFNNTTNISYLHGTANTNGDNADSITVVINDNGNTGSGGGTDQNLGTVNVDITAVNDDPTNAGSLPTDVTVTEDVLTNIDLSAVDFSDVDAASGTLTVTLSTSTGGQLTASAGTGITIGGTATARTFTGTLTDLNNYFNNTTNISYLHGTANTNGDNADSITVVINDNGNTGSGGGTDQNLGTVNVDITAVNDDPTNAGSLPTDVVVTEDVLTNIDLSAVDFSDVDAASGTLVVTLSTSTGGQLTASAGTGITIGGTATARTFTGTLTDLNNYFNNTTNISYLHGTANTNGDNADSITVVINDNGNTGSGGGTDQTLGTVNVDITAVNDEPTTNDTIASGSEGAASIPVVLSGSDLDGTVQWFSLSNLPANGTLYLDSGLTNPAVAGTDIPAVTETLTLYFVPDAYWNGSTNFQFSAKDDLGLLDSTAATATINVSAVNDAPVAASIEGTPVDYNENDGSVQITNTMTLSDVDDTHLESATIQITGNYVTGQDVLAFANTANITGVWDSVAGTLTLTGSDTLANYELALQSITYENLSDDPSAATRTVSFVVNDGNLDSNLQTRDINVIPINDASVQSTIEGSTITYTENDGAVQVTNTITISDLDDTNIESATVQITGNYVAGQDILAFANTANITGVWDSVSGTLTLSGTDTLANYEAALRAVTFENTSENPSTLQRTVSFTANDGDDDSNVVSRSIDVVAVNDDPVAVDDSAVVDEGGTINVAAPGLLNNDSDPEGNSLSATLLTGPAYGVVVVNSDGSYQYTHDGSETTADSFTYQVSDGNGGFDTATVNIGITPVNDVPVANDDSYSVDEGGTLNPVSGVLANDVDGDSDPLSVSLVSGPVNGSLTLNTDGTFSYTHDGSETVFDSFTYQVSDGNGGFDTAIVNLTINPVNDVPVALNDSYSLNEGGTITTSSATGVLANDTDSEGDLLTATLVSGPANGTVTFNADGSFIYTHDGSETTTDQFVYQVSDGNGGVDNAVVILTITPVNDAPVANADNYTIAEESPLSGDVSANDFDAEGDSLTYSLVSGPSSAQSFTLNSDGTFSYLPNTDYFGLDSFTYQVDDGNGGVSTVNVFINVSNINDVPNSAAESYTAISGELYDAVVGVLDNDLDVDGDPLIAILITPPSNGTITFNPDGTFQYVSEDGFVGPDSFFYVANDGTTSGAIVEVSINVELGATVDVGTGSGSATDDGDGDDGDNSESENNETLENVTESTQDDDSQDEENLAESIGVVVNGDSRTEFINNEVRQFKIVELEEIANVNVASRALLQLVQFTSRDSISEILVPTSTVSTATSMSVAFDAQMLWEQMDDFAKQVFESESKIDIDFTLSSITSVATLGGILWVLRGGVLMATTLSQLPTWRMIDPLTVLDSFKSTPTAGEDDLGNFFED